MAETAPHTTPTIASTKACWIETNQAVGMTFAGAGWTPGDPVDYSDNQGGYGTGTVAADGTLALTVASPEIFLSKPGVKQVTATVTDENTDQTATTTFELTQMDAQPSPAEAKPSKKVKWMFSGFKPGAKVYGHFLYKGKQSARASYGKATGPCGLLTTHQTLFPGAHPKHSNYKVQFDSSKKYSKKTTPALHDTFTVTVF